MTRGKPPTSEKRKWKVKEDIPRGTPVISKSISPHHNEKGVPESSENERINPS